jgi:hypothetical protein
MFRGFKVPPERFHDNIVNIISLYRHHSIV